MKGSASLVGSRVRIQCDGGGVDRVKGLFISLAERIQSLYCAGSFISILSAKTENGTKVAGNFSFYHAVMRKAGTS